MSSAEREDGQKRQRLGSLQSVVGIAATLQRSTGTDRAFDILCGQLATLVPFQNFIVYLFKDDAAPVLHQTNLGLPWLQNRMADYINGLYALDPFHRLTVEKATGLFRMRDIMPEAFPESEYFNHFYKDTSVADELRFIVRTSNDTSIHVFVEREGQDNFFDDGEMDLLTEIAPLICAFIESRHQWQIERGSTAIPQPQRFDLRRQIQGLRSGVLTPREVDTVELMLKGHSTKSLARVLGIDDGTVANHKRNIYFKLDVHSAAQLFDLFLRSLTESA